jgi:hypothetical protein
VTVEEATRCYEAVLKAKGTALAAEILRILVHRPFLLDPGVTPAEVNAISFEYEWDSFQPIAIPLNARIGYCGSGAPLAIIAVGEDGLFADSVAEAVIDAIPDANSDEVLEQLDALRTDLFERWFRATWRSVRGAAPGLRGFLSVHDTIWRTDLDTGQTFREDSGAVKFF